MHKAKQIENAERRRRAPVDDSQMVDEMFGFIDTQSDVSESAAPTAFRVWIISSLQGFFLIKSSWIRCVVKDTGIDLSKILEGNQSLRFCPAFLMAVSNTVLV